MRFRRSREVEPAPPSASRPVDQGEREEARLATAVVSGEVPPVWYRQRMTALADQRHRDIERGR